MTSGSGSGAAFAIDASVAVAWVHPAQATGATAAALTMVGEGAQVYAPSIWPLEVANALLVLTRRRRLRPSERQAALGWLAQIPVSIDAEAASLAFNRLGNLADEHGLSIYDASYLELALRLGLPLACKDGPLRSACVAAGVDLL